MKRPYIGITDFMNAAQAAQMLDVFAQGGAEKLGRRLMVGVMMSHKTLNDIPTKWSAAFPKKEFVRDIFISHPLAFNTLHYADYDAIDVPKNIELATSFCGPNLHAIQLDMVWPDPAVVKEYRNRHPWIQVIIQGNSKAVGAVGDDPNAFVNQLKAYDDSVDYVLLDKSMGRGLGMDAPGLLPFARAIAEHIPGMGLAAAGGLGPDTLHLVAPLIAEFPNLSIDAQGKLRPSGSALDPIDWDMAAHYLRTALLQFR